jgi:molecular chaperone DnaK
MSTRLGIDLGTTTTLVARTIEGPGGAVDIRLLPIEQPDGEGGTVSLSYLPSVAYFPPNGEPLVGRAAERHGAQDTARYVRAVKRQMGRRILLPVVERRPVEVATLYLRHALSQARRNFPTDNVTFTVTVPASFTTNQRSDTLQALENACKAEHLPLPRTSDIFISEPVAAMLAFLHEQFLRPQETRQLDLNEPSRVLVYDLGGGTLDLTLVFVEPRRKPVKGLADLKVTVEAISPYNPFGGEDFDRTLAHWMLTRLMDENPALANLDLRTPEQRLAVRLQLMRIAKQAKEDLSQEMDLAPPPDPILGLSEEVSAYYSGTLRLGGVLPPSAVEGDLTAAAYRQIVADLLDGPHGRNLTAPIRELLNRRGHRPEHLAGLLVVGGMARLPLVPETLRAFWGSNQVWVYNPPDQAVVTGAALYSHLREQHPDFSLTEPAADAYYVRTANGFTKLLGPDMTTQSKPNRFLLNDGGSQLLFQVFAGEDAEDDDIENITHTLIYQGGTLIDLPMEYPRDTPVWIEMRYEENGVKDHSKVPLVRVWVKDNTGEPVFTKRYSELVNTQEVSDAPRI